MTTKTMVPYGPGVNQIMKILGLDPALVYSFTFHVECGKLPSLEVKSCVQESTYTGYATKRFTLTEIPDDQVE